MPHKRARGVYKYAEGVRTLSTPMERRKTSAPLCFAGFTAIQKTPHFHQTHKDEFFIFAFATAC